MSEVNKEQAERCAEIGMRALQEGNAAQAMKMFEKSLRMYDSPKVRALLERLKHKDEGSASTSSSHASHAAPSSNAQHAAHSSNRSAGVRHTSTARADGSNNATRRRSPTPQRPYTPEQVELAKQIKRAKTYYEVLGVDKSADADIIKKAYRKLAVKLHPDKNSAPGAEEAFKRVNAAFSILSDGNKRTEYDQHGVELGHAADGGASIHQQPRHSHYAQYEQEISPEDIFNMFFGFQGAQFVHTGNGVHRVYRSAPRTAAADHDDQRVQGQRTMQLMQLLPIILLVIMTLFSFSGSGEEKWFSLDADDNYSIERRTTLVTKDLPYFVQPNFIKRLGGDRHMLYRIEKNVETDLYYGLSRQCAEESQKRTLLEQKIRVAVGNHREKLQQNLQKLHSPGCDALKKYFPHTSRY